MLFYHKITINCILSAIFYIFASKDWFTWRVGNELQTNRKEFSSDQLSTLRTVLEQLGFELLDDQRQQTIDQIKSALIRLVRYRDNQSSTNLSDYLSSELHQDYSALSKLFSEVEGKTLERYYIELRIERVKELIRYDELTLTQIALRMNYSSVAYLSSQFKSVTGMTPSQFKAMKDIPRTSLDKL